MLKKTVSRSVLCLTLATLGACSLIRQSPSPVIAGVGSVPANPYGSAPYVPPSDVADSANHQAAYATRYATVPYVPSTAAVDVGALSHMVVRGDTIYNLAKRYNIDQQELRRINGLVSDTISIGQVLRLRDTAVATDVAGSSVSYNQIAGSPVVSNQVTAPVVNVPLASAPTVTTKTVMKVRTHRVKKGDTLFSIARHYGVTPQQLREINHLNNKGLVRVGEVLKIDKRPVKTLVQTVTQTPVQTPALQSSFSESVQSSTPSNVTTTPAAPVSAAIIRGATRSASGIVWQNPTKAAISQTFGGESRGYKYDGKLGQPVVAAADGKVVYVGNQLRAYGNLIIIQHNRTYLSAYGYNDKMLVKDGQTVKRGQQIATMGTSGTSRPQLYFELRKNGQVVNPANYLP